MNLRDLKLAIAIYDETPEIKKVNSFFHELFGDLRKYIIIDSMFYDNTYYVKNNKLVLIEQLNHNLLKFDYGFIFKQFEDVIGYTDMEEIIVFMIEKYFNIKKFRISHIKIDDYQLFHYYKNQNLIQLII